MTEKSSRWEKLNAISSMLLVLVGVGGIFFAYFQIKESRDESTMQIKESRDEARVQHLVDIVQQFDNPPYSDIRKKLGVERIDTKQRIVRSLNVEDPPNEMIDLLDFCQHLGMLVSRGYLDESDVYGEFADPLFLLYTDARPLIDARQKAEPADWGDCVDLMQVLQRIDNENDNGAANHPSQEDIYEEYNAYAQVPTAGPLPVKRSRPKIRK